MGAMFHGKLHLNAILALALLVMTSLSWVVACRGAHTESNDNSSQSRVILQDQMDYASLLEKLRAKGLKAEQGDEITQPFFSVKGKTIGIDGQSIQVFEYATETDAEAQAKLVDPKGGSVGTTMINWVDDPHFYRSGKLIVLYVGKNSDVTRALEDTIERQFAGKQ